jgi:rapamycin-insensitive companion of mTOR
MPPNINDAHDSPGVAPAHQSISSQSTALSTSHETDNANRASDDQLEALTALLERENRIKEGAEKFLKLPITDTMRMQVESELEMATHEIEMLTKRIEQETSRGKRRRNGVGPTTKRKFAGQAPPSSVRFRADSDDRDRDDFRTALNQANAYLKSLALTSRSSSSTPAAASSSSTSPSPTNSELDKARIDIINKLVNLLQRNLRVRYELSVSDLVQAVIPSLSDNSSKHCRAAAYRLIRHSLVDSASVEELHRQPLEWFIVKSLARDNKHAVEREQVIKLIRAVVDIVSEKRDRRGNTGSNLVPLSEPIMRAFVAVAEHAEDPFRQICVQTLAEMSS